MFGNKKVIRIEFFHVDNGSAIGYDEHPLKDIPDSFKVETQVDLDGTKWDVVNVHPRKRREVKRSGRMTVFLREPGKEAEAADANGASSTAATETDTSTTETTATETVDVPILGSQHSGRVFLRASRADLLPETDASVTNGHLLTMRLSEWRDMELIPADQLDAVKVELGQIDHMRKIARAERDGQTVYRDQHVRALVPAPLAEEGLTVEQLRTGYFPFAPELKSVAFMREDGAAVDVFALEARSGLHLYGQQKEGVIQCLALHPVEEATADHLFEDLNQLMLLMQARELRLVDWTEGRVVAPDIRELNAYFVGADVAAEEMGLREEE